MVAVQMLLHTWTWQWETMDHERVRWKKGCNALLPILVIDKDNCIVDETKKTQHDLLDGLCWTSAQENKGQITHKFAAIFFLFFLARPSSLRWSADSYNAQNETPKQLKTDKKGHSPISARGIIWKKMYHTSAIHRWKAETFLFPMM